MGSLKSHLVLLVGLLTASCQSADHQLWSKLQRHNLQAIQQGNFKEASIVAQQAYDLAQKSFGAKDGKTLISLSSLANVYYYQGRYGKAVPLFERVLTLRRETLGEQHPTTLGILHNLAVVYADQGRYGEAEPLLQKALTQYREVLGDQNSETLRSLHSLATVLGDQGHYDDAEPLLLQALEFRQETLGEQHPDTLESLQSLATLYARLGRFSEAEPLFQQALNLRRETLGEQHPGTLFSLNSLASVFERQNHDNHSESLYEQVLKLRRETLGEQHPDTLQSLNDLALLYSKQGRYDEAEPLYQQALELRRKTLGESHPSTLRTELSSALALVSLGLFPEALARLQENGDARLAYAESELSTTKGGTTRNLLLESQARYQDLVISLALQHPVAESVALAGNVMLSWKQIQGAEAAFVAHLLRTNNNPDIQAIAKEITALRARLARVAQANDPNQNPVEVLEELEVKELALARLSDSYKQRKESRRASVDQLQAILPEDTGVIELRQYRTTSFKTRTQSEPRFAALLVRPNQPPVLVDAGSVGLADQLLQDLRAHDEPARVEDAEAKLYQQLFSGFGDKLDALKKIYIAPDGLLHMVPFELLRREDGGYLGEQQALRFVPTGRDLLIQTASEGEGQGLLALGGVDFGSNGEGGAEEATPVLAALDQRKVDTTRDQVRSLFEDFDPLPASGDEVSRIAAIYRQQRPADPVTIWTGDTPTEARLKTMEGLNQAPRVLHVATHGFYLPTAYQTVERQQLYSGLVMAGANRYLEGGADKIDMGDEDGILYSLEAQDLNLEGTELVVLSACDTGKGVVDYSEGVVGMVQALRIAGAKQVLVTLWPVLDKATAVFMETFYQNWLSHPEQDAAEALARTKQMFRQDENTSYRRPLIWAPFVLVGA